MFVIEERANRSFWFLVFGFLFVCVCVFFLALRIETGVNTRTGVNTELKNPGNLIMPLPERPISGYSYISKPEHTTTRHTSFDRQHTEQGQL